MSDLAPGSLGRSVWEDVLKLPAQILCVGGVILLLFAGLRWTGLPGLAALGTAGPGGSWPVLLVGASVFLVGVGLAVFLWWLCSRFFGLLRDGKMDGAGLAALKDLPMGLPEGTVRSLLALVVAVIGLPLLLFGNILNLDDAIAGYVNGIITGVFGFYFGTRTAGVPSQAVDRIAGAQQQAIQKAEEAARVRAEAQTAIQTAQQQAAQTAENAAQVQAEAQTAIQAAQQQAARTAAEAARAQATAAFDATLDRLTRHVALARTLLKVFGPALPAGMIPPEVGRAFETAEAALAAVQGLGREQVTAEQVKTLADAAETLTGKDSPLAVLLGKAAPLLGGVLPIPGLGQFAGIAMLVSLGVKLGSSQFQRWRARILAAPLAQGLIEFGALTPELIHAALRRAPTLRDALAARPDGEVDSTLADAALRDDGAARLLAAYGPAGTLAAGLLPDLDHAEAALDELRQSLLSLYGAEDVQETALRHATGSLAGATHPDLASTQVQAAMRSMSPADANRLIDAAAGASARQDAPEEERAAFDALVTLVDTARRENIDLARAISELTP